MMNDIFCVGLTRTELQTLGVLLPITFRIIPVSSEELDHAAVVRVIDQARCIILNPKRLSVDLLDDFLRGQDYQRWNDAPVPIILFSGTMTKEQRREVFMPEYPILSVDLHERFDRNRNLAVKLLRESALPCWQNREAMRSNMFNDAWYLIDIETTGLDRWKDRIIAIRIARMANYEINWERPTIYIRQDKPLPAQISEITGITDDMLAGGVSMEEALEELDSLPCKAKKSEADKHVLEIDPVTAPVVRHIFDLRLQGYGFRKIALQLNAEKVPAPRSFYYMAEGRENLRGETPFWNDVTVKTILRNEVYIGHMVQNKTGTVSYKNHKQVSKPESEWIKVENTHEPLIPQETWDAVQRMDNHPARGRSGKSGTVALFGGLLRCMDCGSSMRYMRDYRKKISEKEPEYKAYVCNRYASGGKNACSSHYINQKVLTQIVMTDIRCKAMWAQNSRETLRTQLLAREQNASAERTRTLQAELNAIGKRIPELDKLIQSAYEDKVLGRIPESVCVNLLSQYEAERREKQERHKELTGQLAASRETESSVDAWLDMMQDYAQLEELDRPTLVRLIQKIEISERYTVDDHEERDIHIYYNFVGYTEA